MNQKGSVAIVFLSLVLVALLIGVYLINFKPIKIQSKITIQDTIPRSVPVVTNKKPDDNRCDTQPSFMLNEPVDSESYTSQVKAYGWDFCLYQLTLKNSTIFIAPTGNYDKWKATGEGKHTNKALSVKIGNQQVEGEEHIPLREDETTTSNVTLLGIQGYDFGISFINQDQSTKDEVSRVLSTFQLK